MGATCTLNRVHKHCKIKEGQLLFNWQLGRDLVICKAEKKWGPGIVEQVSLDLQAEFPNAKGFVFVLIKVFHIIRCLRIS